MNVLEKFYKISGNEVTRDEIKNLISEAKQANETEVIYRLSKVLLENPNTESFIIDLKKHSTALNAPRHKGVYKEALTECGRLRKGWKFEKGSVVKIPVLNKKTGQYKASLNQPKEGIILTFENVNIDDEEFTPTIKYRSFSDDYSANFGTHTEYSKNLQDLLDEMLGAGFLLNKKKVNTPSKKKKQTYNSFKKDVKNSIEDIRNNVEKQDKISAELHVYSMDIDLSKTDKKKSLEKSYNFVEKKINNSIKTLSVVCRCSVEDIIHVVFDVYHSKTDLEKWIKLAFDRRNNKTTLSKMGSPLNFKTLKEAKKYYLAWAFENLRGKKYFHKELGKWVVFNRKGIEHTLSSRISFKKLELITQAEQMLDDSTLIVFEADYKKRRNVKGAYKMQSKAILKDEIVSVLLTLREGENGVIYYDHKVDEVEKLAAPRKGTKRAKSFCADKSLYNKDKKTSVSSKNRTTSLGEKTPIVKRRNESFTDEPSNKVTKTKPNPQRVTKKNKGLGVPNTNPNSLAYKLANRSNRTTEFYEINDKHISDFLGKIEIKEKESVVITVTGGQGSMKTRFAFRCMNAFAKKHKTGHASIEEHPDSTVYWDKVHEYISEESLLNIENPEIKDTTALDKLIRENEVIIIDSFAKLQEFDSRFEVDKDLRKKYDGKLFIVVFQQTSDGKMRGGTKSQYDADIVLFTEKFTDYKDNYVYTDKNRYQNKNLGDLEYNIFHGKLNEKNTEKDMEDNLEIAERLLNPQKQLAQQRV